MNAHLLDALAADDREALRRTMQRRKYPRGQHLIFEGESGTTLHLLDKGRVAVRVGTPLGDVATLAVLAPGDCFGELALVSPDHRRTSSIVALEAVETLTLERPAFLELCAQRPAVMTALVDILASQVKRLSGQVSEAYFVAADQRVVRRLSHLTSVYPTSDDGTCSIPLTQDDLASMAGTTRPTANRALRTLATKGVVALRRGSIDVLDPVRLAAAIR